MIPDVRKKYLLMTIDVKNNPFFLYFFFFHYLCIAKC